MKYSTFILDVKINDRQYEAWNNVESNQPIIYVVLLKSGIPYLLTILDCGNIFFDQSEVKSVSSRGDISVEASFNMTLSGNTLSPKDFVSIQFLRYYFIHAFIFSSCI
jgi:hypothetical protein